MTNLLRKLFIKDFNNLSNSKVRGKHGLLASIVGIITNFLLFLFKIVIGFIVGSMTIVTDAVNNLTDMASCVVNIIGFKVSSKPADKEHPFGHERIEYIAGMIISFVIIALACVLGYSSVLKIIYKDYSFYTNSTFVIALVILVVSILVKLWQSFFYKKMSKLINSVSLKASSQDALNDVITTSFVLLATILEFVLAQYNVHLDAYFSIAVAIFIVISGIKLIIETSNPLIGITPDHKLVQSAISDIKAYQGVLGVHDVMCHQYGPTKVFMTLHVEVDARVDVMISHELIDYIENEIGQKYNMVLTIHLDPVQIDSPEINDLREKTKQFLDNLDKSLSFHDLRIVKGENRTNVIFDVLVPYNLKLSSEDIISYLSDEYKKIDPHYNLVVKIDYDYIDNTNE